VIVQLFIYVAPTDKTIGKGKRGYGKVMGPKNSYSILNECEPVVSKYTYIFSLRSRRSLSSSYVMPYLFLYIPRVSNSK